MSIVIVFSTLPDVNQANLVAKTLVEEGLVACVNILPGVQSVYRWQGQIESSAEVMLLIKTTEQAYPELEQKIKALHPYELPEIMAISPVAGLPAYLDWVVQSVSSSTDKDQ